MAVTPQWMVQGREAIHSRHGTVLSVAVTAQHRRAMRIARCRYIFVNSETPHQDFFLRPCLFNTCIFKRPIFSEGFGHVSKPSKGVLVYFVSSAAAPRFIVKRVQVCILLGQNGWSKTGGDGGFSRRIVPSRFVDIPSQNAGPPWSCDHSRQICAAALPDDAKRRLEKHARTGRL